MKEGAFDYLTKPVSGEELAAAVERALLDASEDDAATDQALSTLADAESDHEILIGNSVLMQRGARTVAPGSKVRFHHFSHRRIRYRQRVGCAFRAYSLRTIQGFLYSGSL